MKLYKLECLNQDGHIETNGYFLNPENAKNEKGMLDNSPENEKYGILQNIIEIETQD